MLKQDFGWLDNLVRAKKASRLPVVFTDEEADRVIGFLDLLNWIFAILMYGSGLRVGECVRLRVKDLDLQRRMITVRNAKGHKDRATMLAECLVLPLTEHLRHVRAAHERAVERGYAGVHLPYALARKYPNAETEWQWQYVFPAEKPSIDPRSRLRRRHHLHKSV